MANEDRSAGGRTVSDSAAQTGTNGDSPQQEPMFRPFEQFHVAVDNAKLPGGPIRAFASTVLDLALGACTIAEMLEQDSMRDAFDDPEPPLLNDFHRGTLQRMLIAQSRVLATEAQNVMDWAYEDHTPEGRADRLEKARFAFRMGGR
jgi:hypothetical protein